MKANKHKITIDDLAISVSNSFWHMQGGDGENPALPTPGDYQIAHDIMVILKRGTKR